MLGRFHVCVRACACVRVCVCVCVCARTCISTPPSFSSCISDLFSCCCSPFNPNSCSSSSISSPTSFLPETHRHNISSSHATPCNGEDRGKYVNATLSYVSRKAPLIPTRGFQNYNGIMNGTIVCLIFHPMSKEHVHALKGLACRKRVAAASSPAATSKQGAALTSPARHACGCARLSRARLCHTNSEAKR